MRQPKAFVSPYAKADVRKRAAAAIADGLLVATCVVLSSTQDSMLFIAIGAAYLLLRDALFIPGQSVGKFLFGLRVISLDRWPTLQPLAFGPAKLHPARARTERRGRRARDHCDRARSAGATAGRYAREHAGGRRASSARELATSFQRALLDVPIGRERDEQPVEVK